MLLACDSGLAADACAPLRAAGHRVDVTEPIPAVQAAARGGYDLVVVIASAADCEPLIRALRDDAELERLYLLAGCIDGDSRSYGALAGVADDILIAPLDPAELSFRAGRAMQIVALRDELALAERALREQAMSDPLTGLPNRRAMEQMVVTEAARVSRSGAASCVVCVDLDGFQTVNALHGETVGDLMLVAFSSAIRSNLRTQDEFGRMDGDEFVILLRDTTLEGALDACGRLRDAVAAARVPLGRGDLELSASFGIAPIMPGDDPGQVLDVADCALYTARTAGRNRIEVATESLA